MATIELTKENFNEVIESNETVLIDFWAEWCGPCRMFGPIFEEASAKHEGIVFAKVDTEAQPEIAGAFQIMSIPTLMAFRDQILLYADAGAMPADALEQLIGKINALDMDDVRAQIAEAEKTQAAQA